MLTYDVLLQTMIKRYVHWNEDIGEWQLKCVAYTGNNMRKAQTASPAGNNKEVRFVLLITKKRIILKISFFAIFLRNGNILVKFLPKRHKSP